MADFRLRTLKPHYEQLFSSCQIRSSWLDRIASAADTIVRLRSQYYDAIEAHTTIPWWFTGILHYREASFRDAHLHNGDPLTGRTYREPPNRPAAPPANGRVYTFVESAVDALRWKTFDTAQDRSIAAWLWRFELWNGFGYAMRGINSEYLWNGTNHFGSGIHRGKFVADGSFDPNAPSEQVGAAALLWYFYYKGTIQENSGTATLNRFDTSPAVGLSSTFAVQQQEVIQLLDACKDYQELPDQNLAIAWLQQQQPLSVLTEFAQRWRERPNPVATSTVQPTVPVPTAIASIPTPLESVNPAIVNAALSLRGMSSAQGPDGGRNACAWAVNRVLQKAGIQPLGNNPNLVSSLVDELNRGRGRQVTRDEAKPGDLVIAYRYAHIGIGLTDGCQRVLSNSSSRARFVWESGTDFDGYYRGPSTIYRLLR
ncbi:MAG TPA: hypothetical protein V6C91_05220 [Coleofasciculaceae cyanobacterium]